MQEIFNLIQIRTLYKQEDKQHLVDKIDLLIETILNNLLTQINEKD